MAKKFIAYSPYGSVQPDEAHLTNLFHQLLEHGCMIVTDNGFICGTLSPLFFAPHVVIGAELAWWSEDGQGDALKDAFEDWALAAGAAGAQFSALNNQFAPRMAKRLTEDGYVPVEVGYMKVF